MTVGVDSWASLAEANTYFSSKWGASDWALLTILQREQLLVSAYMWIKSLPGVSIADSSTDIRVKRAQMETAWYLYKYSEEHNKHAAMSAQGVKSFTVLDFSETLSGNVQFPLSILGTLDDFLTNLGGKKITLYRDF